jgi:hypothetical protein
VIAALDERTREDLLDAARLDDGAALGRPLEVVR